jgi:hypothetical protein
VEIVRIGDPDLEIVRIGDPDFEFDPKSIWYDSLIVGGFIIYFLIRRAHTYRRPLLIALQECLLLGMPATSERQG